MMKEKSCSFFLLSRIPPPPRCNPPMTLCRHAGDGKIRAGVNLCSIVLHCSLATVDCLTYLPGEREGERFLPPPLSTTYGRSSSAGVFLRRARGCSVERRCRCRQKVFSVDFLPRADPTSIFRRVSHKRHQLQWLVMLETPPTTALPHVVNLHPIDG